jgi:hypothetical protein
VLFTDDVYPGLADGSITLTFRAWRRPQAKVGGRFRKRDLLFEVDAVEVVPVDSISPADARRAGTDVVGVRARLGEATEAYRIAFHRVEDHEPSLADQADLSPAEVAELTRRLDRLDAAGSRGPWTRPTLALIAEHPGLVSTELAARLGRDRPSFKIDVRKLKRLGLTISLEIGYRLSPRGAAYVEAITEAGEGDT